MGILFGLVSLLKLHYRFKIQIWHLTPHINIFQVYNHFNQQVSTGHYWYIMYPGNTTPKVITRNVTVQSKISES